MAQTGEKGRPVWGMNNVVDLSWETMRGKRNIVNDDFITDNLFNQKKIRSKYMSGEFGCLVSFSKCFVGM